MSRDRRHVLGGLALLLAGMGIYGTIGYAVAQRTREMGIPLALGTTPARLRGAVFGRTFVVIGCGAAAGLAMALAGGQYLQSLIAGAEQGLLGTTAIVVTVTAAIGAVAVWTATRRIAQLHIADVLRAESAD